MKRGIKTIAILLVLLFAAACGQTRQLSTRRDGLKIYGEIVLPANYSTGKLPVVIFAHGFMGNSEAQKDIAAKLAQNGIASYCFDFCGGTTKDRGCKSDGEFEDMTILTEKADLHAVIDFIKQQEFTDTSNIYLFGESLGGAVSALAAAERPEDIKAQILFYPAFSVIQQAKIIYKTPENVPDKTLAVGGGLINGEFYRVALGIDIYNEIAPYKGPVLIFQGDEDNVVPKYFVDQAVQRYANAELVVYEGEGHVFSQEYEDMAVEQMIEFIQAL